MAKRRSVRGVVLAALVGAACANGDPRVPWDEGEMMRGLVSNLRRFENVTVEVAEFEVLAWRAVDRESNRKKVPAGLPPIVSRHHGETAIVWARVTQSDGRSEWLLIDGFRAEDGWQRAAFSHDWVKPPAHLRPGVSADGVFHGFARFATPPTPQEICEFMSENFMRTVPDDASATLVAESGGLRVDAWRRRAGGEPPCAPTPH